MTQAIFADRGHGGIKGEQKLKQMFWNTSKNKLTMINVATLHTLPHILMETMDILPAI